MMKSPKVPPTPLFHPPILGHSINLFLACGEMLADNKSLEVFNCETNFITTNGIIAMIEPLRYCCLSDQFSFEVNLKTQLKILKFSQFRIFRMNTSLVELRIANQRSKLANKAEENLMNVMEANNSIKKLGYTFSCPGPRHMVGSFITRNVDLARQKRT